MTTKERLAAKLPGEDTGISLHNTFCDICAPGPHCGVTCYVKDGKIIERGSHPELLEQKGYYYELYSRQFEEEEAMKVFAGATFAGETDWESVCQP